jgi:C1A family cysteine protease
MYRFGWIPDSEEKKGKDWKAEPLLVKVSTRPPSVNLRHLILSILDQSNLGSCVTNAGAQAIRGALVAAGVAAPELLSRLFAYYYARALSPGNTQVDSGTQIRCFFDVIRKIGFCPEAAWPYDTSRFAKMPAASAARAAFDQKTSFGYYSIASTGVKRIEDICTALAGGHLVVFGTLVGDAFAGYTAGAPALIPPSGKILGGHALVVDGYKPGPSYDTLDFDIVNSWGPEWGVGGCCVMSDAYLAWGETRDLWIVEQAPPFSAAA